MEKRLKKTISGPNPDDTSSSTTAAAAALHTCSIDRLPDDLLTSIISHLPILEAVRTSILSQRWKDLWTYTDLNFQQKDLSEYKARSLLQQKDKQKKRKRRKRNCPEENCPKEWLIRAIDGILSMHKGLIHSFQCNLSEMRCAYKYGFEEWLRKVVEKKGLKELDLEGNYDLELLASVLDLEGLRILRVDSCKLPKFGISSPTVRLSNLTELCLQQVPLTDDVVAALLSACQLLDKMFILYCSGLLQIRVQLQHLHVLHFKGGYEGMGIIVEDAPKLQELVASSLTKIQVIHAPELRTLVVLSFTVKQLEVCGNHIKTSSPNKIANSSSVALHNLKVLGVQMNLKNESHLKMLSKLLSCCNNLERLDVEFVTSDPRESKFWKLEDWEKQGPFTCLENHLQYVNITWFLQRRQVEAFARYLIENAQVLKKMTFHCPKSLRDRWRKGADDKLGVQNKASRDAETCFLFF